MLVSEPLATTLPDGRTLETLYACDVCHAPMLPVHGTHRVCDREECKVTWKKSIDHARYVTRSPDWLVQARGRVRAHFACKSENYWVRGAPPYGQHLPGGAMTIDVSPPPKWSVEHRNIRAVHGMITKSLGLDGHCRLYPDFSIVPWHNQFGWALYVADDTHKHLANKTIDAVLFDREVKLKFGIWSKLRAPDWKAESRGRKRVEVSTITPVVIRTDRRIVREKPTNESIHSALTAMFPLRLGWVDRLEYLEELRKETMVNIVSSDTKTDTIKVGGHFDNVTGFMGRFVVEANAPARWLLKCAQLIGLGGQTSIGFGRIKCREI
jgi:CRISPR-associated endoribonuclease Cas6